MREIARTSARKQLVDLVDEWGFSSEDAFMFLSVAGDLGIAAYYHPSPGSVVARMRVPKLASSPPFRL